METITTKFDNFGKLSISENRRYLMEGDKPFFWLGDTAWLMLLKLNEDEIYTYLRNRKEKGYNVIQTVLIQSPQDVESSLASGRKDVTKSEYWNLLIRYWIWQSRWDSILVCFLPGDLLLKQIY